MSNSKPASYSTLRIETHQTALLSLEAIVMAGVPICEYKEIDDGKWRYRIVFPAVCNSLAFAALEKIGIKPKLD
jgi:hypothetical protein